jgi:hypothetical protein
MAQPLMRLVDGLSLATLQHLAEAVDDGNRTDAL